MVRRWQHLKAQVCRLDRLSFHKQSRPVDRQDTCRHRPTAAPSSILLNTRHQRIRPEFAPFPGQGLDTEAIDDAVTHRSGRHPALAGGSVDQDQVYKADNPASNKALIQPLI
jgi:hypothetical protein